MIIGTFSVPRVVEECICRSSKEYEFSEVGDYKIHSTTLMPNIKFEEAEILSESIDTSIFINDEDTKLEIEETIKCQNFLTTNYVGRAPLEFYGPKTKMGREFVLICRDGDPTYKSRVFGTEDAIRGYNRNSTHNFVHPKHKEEVYKGNVENIKS
jgi:hypothetical protein